MYGVYVWERDRERNKMSTSNILLYTNVYGVEICQLFSIYEIRSKKKKKLIANKMINSHTIQFHNGVDDTMWRKKYNTNDGNNWWMNTTKTNN